MMMRSSPSILTSVPDHLPNRIVAVGTGARSEEGKVTPLDVKAGDKILFGKWSGTEVKIDGEDLIIMKESDILGIVG